MSVLCQGTTARNGPEGVLNLPELGKVFLWIVVFCPLIKVFMLHRLYRKTKASQIFSSVIQFSEKGLVNGQEVSCSKCALCPCEPVCTGVSEPVWAGTNCCCIWPWQQLGRSGVHSPVMHFGVLGVEFWFFIVSSSFLDRGVPVVRF